MPATNKRFDIVEAMPRSTPDWLPAEMPPGYRNRLEEIQRLTRDLDEMGRFGRLLYGVGAELREAVREVFDTLEFDTTRTAATGPIVVGLDGQRRRLLLHVSESERPIQRRDPDLATVFQMLHEVAESGDRVVLVANVDANVRPSDRAEGMDAEAATFLRRLGANFVPAPALFALWSMSIGERVRARTLVENLHAQDGGVFRSIS